MHKVTDYTYKIDIGDKSRLHPVVPHDLLRLATNYQPEQSPIQDYDPINLDLDHTLEILPHVDTPQEREDIENYPQAAPDRPIIQIGPLAADPPARVLRDRNLIQPPDYYQAGFNN